MFTFVGFSLQLNYVSLTAVRILMMMMIMVMVPCGWHP